MPNETGNTEPRPAIWEAYGKQAGKMRPQKPEGSWGRVRSSLSDRPDETRGKPAGCLNNAGFEAPVPLESSGAKRGDPAHRVSIRLDRLGQTQGRDGAESLAAVEVGRQLPEQQAGQTIAMDCALLDVEHMTADHAPLSERPIRVYPGGTARRDSFHAPIGFIRAMGDGLPRRSRPIRYT